MNTFFDDFTTKADVLKLYHKKLDELAIPYESIFVETSFGDTHVLLTGNENGPPLVLLHGSNGCAPVGIEALIGLCEDYRVYAIDVLGQPNLSDEFRPSMSNDDYGKWMMDVFARLNIRNATLVGISFGGFITWKTLVFDTRRIAQAFLIVPAGIVNGNPLKALLRVFLPMKRYKRTLKERYVQQFLDQLFTEKDEFAFAFLSKVFRHYRMDFSPIPVVKSSQARQIKVPVYVVGAENDLLFPGRKMLKRAKKIFPSLKGTLLLTSSKHVPDKQSNEQIEQWIKDQTLVQQL